ncbi:hypothetical protein H9P43_010051 [Blastocladiella emersonii ATCC 22665]|nr:hypothetical protein H9P43_010051 [Blastocladiella emersonii ATCC 22665]
MLAAVAYWTSYLTTSTTGAVVVMAGSFTIAMLACVIAYRAMGRLDLYSRNFGYSALLYIGYHLTRGIPKLMYTVLATKPGAAAATWVIFGFRMLYATFVLFIDEFMLATFGNPILWGTFYTRIGEALVTICAVMNYTNNTTDVLIYMLGNVIMTSLKDSGVAEDLRFLRTHGYCVLSPPTTIGSDVDSGPRGIMSTTGAVAAESMVRSSMGAGATSLRRTSDIDRVASTPHLAAQPAITSKADKIQLMAFDLRLQIARSEMMLMARVGAIIIYLVCLGVACATGLTNSTKVQFPASTMIAVELLVGTVIEIVVSRVVATFIFRWKVARLRGLAAKEQGLTSTTSAAAASVNGSASASPNGSGSVAINAAHKRPPSPRGIRLGLALWSTALPSNTDFFYLVLMSCAFACSIQMGPWTT